MVIYGLAIMIIGMEQVLIRGIKMDRIKENQEKLANDICKRVKEMMLFAFDGKSQKFSIYIKMDAQEEPQILFYDKEVR